MRWYSRPRCPTASASSSIQSRSRGSSSPATFARAQRHWSQSSGRSATAGDATTPRTASTTPAPTMADVCAPLPDAMFVSTHAASNCMTGEESRRRSTSTGRPPASMTSCVQGLALLHNRPRSLVSALNAATGSLLALPASSTSLATSVSAAAPAGPPAQPRGPPPLHVRRLLREGRQSGCATEAESLRLRTANSATLSCSGLHAAPAARLLPPHPNPNRRRCSRLSACAAAALAGPARSRPNTRERRSGMM
mmetsp:Transcript_32090/g.92216  ORF Transcript_32090/g.92216 Transcript_32090/m.92216 type:complete len:252 (-) Transcript_32090:80-835(-)